MPLMLMLPAVRKSPRRRCRDEPIWHSTGLSHSPPRSNIFLLECVALMYSLFFPNLFFGSNLHVDLFFSTVSGHAYDQ